MSADADKSFLSSDLQITGEIRSAGDIEVNGVIDGEITCRTLTIGRDAALKGKAKAETVRIQGTLKGQVEAGDVALVKTAKVEGEILHRSLSVEPGAFLEGRAQRLGAESAPAELPRVAKSAGA